MKMNTREYEHMRNMIKQHYNPKNYGEDDFLITLICELKYKPCVRVFGDEVTLLYERENDLKRLVIELFLPYMTFWEAKEKKDEEGNELYIPEEMRTYLLDKKLLNETIEKFVNG